MTVKVVEKQDEREVTSRKSGRQHRVAEFLVADDSGSVILTLWDDDIDKIEPGNTYLIKNGYVNTFRNSMRLNTGRYGSIEPTDEDVGEVDTENNVSDKFVEERKRF